MHLSDLLDEIWRALAKPAASYAEITARVNVALAAKGMARTSHASVDQAIYQLRHAGPGYYGWTIPHCKRGPALDGRLFRVAVVAGVPLTLHKAEGVRVGATGTVRHVGTIMDHGAGMMTILVPMLADLKLRRKAKGLIRKMEFIAEEAREMEEALAEQKWG